MCKLKQKMAPSARVLFIIIGTILLMNCVSSGVNNINFSEIYLTEDMPTFSITEPTLNHQARNWYFAPYASIIPGVRIHSGTYLSRGEILAAHMLWGENDDQGTVIMIHGYDGTVLNTHFQYFAQQFIAKGYRVILLNLPGHGFSGGKRGDVKDFSDYRQMLADFLALTEGQLGDNLVLIGHSLGASTIYDSFVKFPAAVKEVDAVVLLSPFNDLKFSDLYQLGAFLAPSAGVDIEQKSVLRLYSFPSNWIKKEKQWSNEIKDYPVLVEQEMLLVYAGQDKVVNSEKSQKFFREKIANKEIRVYYEQGHAFVEPGYKEFRTETMEWILSRLSDTDAKS